MSKTMRMVVTVMGFWACFSGLLKAAGSKIPKEDFTLKQDRIGYTVRTVDGLTRLEILGDRTIRVIHTPSDQLPQRQSQAVIATPGKTDWQLKDSGAFLQMSTPVLTVQVDKVTGRVQFMDHSGKIFLAEAEDGTSLEPATVGVAETLHVSQQFKRDPKEALYGLGQHQQGYMNYTGKSVHLQQENREVAVPVLLSSKGYVLLWDNPAVTDVNMGTGAEQTIPEHSLPNESDNSVVSWSSEAGNAVDYYVMYGPQPDQAISAYRQLTGTVPMFPKWTWGFWQCKERYKTQEELLGVLYEYRKRGIPLDGIIQDWQYWASGQWGSHEFDAERYPDPAAMVKAIHAANAHTIISVWPRFDLETLHLAEFEQAGAVYPPVYKNAYPEGKGKWYDPFNPKGRQLYWQQLYKTLVGLDFDGWWMDACEAELGAQWGQMRELQTGAGSGAEVYNAYPLMHTRGVYEGQRQRVPQKRVFILARSAYAGQQRNGVVTWSGDINGSWEVFAQQIPAGLNFCASGIPYWNTDIGGFFGGDPANAGYQELFTRWFQFGTFCPMFRIHGTGKGKEMWRFDEPTQKILLDYDRLRYHLLPYIYSVAWQVTRNGYTMMRPLVMDFANDEKVYEIADQYMFGPAMMVNPVIEAGAKSRSVYLPVDSMWYDFWTGKTFEGGQAVETKASIETMPLFVRAGSIIPYGPAVQYADENPGAPIELRVYPGADGTFTLYEDEGDNYNYEKGAYATIDIRWDDQKQELIIGDRKGTFPGMVAERTFRIVRVNGASGGGLQPTENVGAEVKYTGRKIQTPVPIVTALPAPEETPKAVIKVGGEAKTISPDLFGIFFEDLNYAADGGLYAELIQNRSFEYRPVDHVGWDAFTGWELVYRGRARGGYIIGDANPLHPNNPYYLEMDCNAEGEDAAVGLVNSGFDGIVLKKGAGYDFSVFARQQPGRNISLEVRLESKDGALLGRAAIPQLTSEWKRYAVTIQSKEDRSDARLVLLAKGRGVVYLDMISLFPQKTFKNRANGLRQDLAQVIADLKPKFIRFPGGCLVHGDGLSNLYRWKDTIGPVHERKEQKNIWRYHQTVGLGYFEYFQFCEDIGAKPLPVVAAGVSCQNTDRYWGVGQQAISMDEMEDYVQEVLDLIEWANGPVDSEWGAKRAAAGHPEPFNLKYLGLGNEDVISPAFKERYKMINDAIQAKYPGIIVIGTTGPATDGRDYEEGWKFAKEEKMPMVDEHGYKSPDWFWDNLRRFDAYDRTGPKVYLGEYAAHDRGRANTLRSALSEAAYMTALERNGDLVHFSSYAPLLSKQGHTQWRPDMIYFDNLSITPSINYYVQQLFSVNCGDVYLPTTTSMQNVAVSTVRDMETGDVIVKIVSRADEAITATVDLSSMGPLESKAVCTVLSGDPMAENRFGRTPAVLPIESEMEVRDIFDYEILPHSLSVIRMKKR